jgi:dTDP-4-amino-4,6-dideoxygalactose transaminase
MVCQYEFNPMHMQPVFEVEGRRAQGVRGKAGERKYNVRVVGGAVSEDLFARGLCLPSGTAMSDEDLDRVASVIGGIRRKAAAGSRGRAV